MCVGMAMADMTGQEYSLHVQCVGMNAGNDSNDRTGERSLHAVCVKEEGRMLTGNVKAFIQILHFIITSDFSKFV